MSGTSQRLVPDSRLMTHACWSADIHMCTAEGPLVPIES